MDSLLDVTKDAVGAWEPPTQEDYSGAAYWAEALADFEGKFADEMTFAEWETMAVLGVVGNGWLEARLGDSTGLVPESYVERLQRGVARASGGEGAVVGLREAHAAVKMGDCGR